MKSEPLSDTDVNRQMLELKKKIQLSEGQRKAAFEDCEAERKSNVEEIHKLKKDIAELVKELKDRTQATAALGNLSKKLEKIVGPCDGKDVEEIRNMVDLQIIDKAKALDLVNYRIRKQQKALTQLAKEYQNLISQKALKEVTEKVDKPTRKTTCDLQNSIHAVEIQLREANHISIRYRDIKKSLMRDAARFESNIKTIEEDLEAQRSDINALQQIMAEATQKRGAARSHLLREERVATANANSRDRQTCEGRRLVTKRRHELELLEKRIFQVAKTPTRQAEADDAQPATDDEVPETPSPVEDHLSAAFEVLKKATGATNSDEVFHKFNAQKDTFERLLLLRKQAEEEKRKLEKEAEQLEAQMEFFKFAEVQDGERKTIKLDRIQALITTEEKRSQKAIAARLIKDKILKTILKAVLELQTCINPLSIPGDDILTAITQINKDLVIVLDRVKNEPVEEEETVSAVEVPEEKWLPAPYSGLVRRTPIPQPGASPAPPLPPGSEDEDEVPSRTYLKRQAQLVVDAKLRRKNVRLPQKKN